MPNKEQIIQGYVHAYNHFDTNKMVEHLDDHIVFENLSNGKINMTVSGIKAFKEQAEQAKTYFKQRKQTITAFKHLDNVVEISISYFAILAMDLPNGLRENQTLELTGKSIFTFERDKIIKLVDIS